jgi:arylsulfatase A-like enzyme
MTHTKTPPLAAGIVTPAGIAQTVPLGVLYAMETLGIKIAQLNALDGEVSIATLCRVFAPDLAFALSVTAVFCFLVSRLPPPGRALATVLHAVVMTYALLFTGASHGFFQATGENLSWSHIDVWISNFKEVREVMASEETGSRALFAYGQVLPALLLALLPFLPRLRRALRARPILPTRTALTALAAPLAASLLLALVPEASGQAQTISRCVAMDILEDFARDELLPEPEVVISSQERLDGSLVLERKPDAPQLNVVLMLFESLNWKSSDVFTPGLGVTPFLEELAKQSLVVETQYTVLPHTTKALVPINCGIYPYLDTEAREATPGILPRRCLAHILRNHGYATAFFQPAGDFEKRDRLVANMGYETYRGLNDMPQEGFEQTNYFGREEKMMLRPSMDWVDAQKGRPFLLTYLTLSTHHNYVTPQSFPTRDYPVDDLDHRNFYNAARYIDTFFAEAFAEFEKRGLLDNTVFIIVGDHGEAFGEHGRRQHDLVLWEEGIHAFSMLHSPKLFPEPGRITGTRSHLDIVPTVCDLLGIEVKQGEFLGSSLLAPVPDDRTLYFSCWFKRRCLAMRQGPVKTLFHYGLKQMEVYDNESDPFDLTNLANIPPTDKAFLDARRGDMERWAAVVNRQYDEWEDNLAAGVVSTTRPEIATPLPATFSDRIELVGVDAAPAQADAGQDIKVTYVFKALKPLEPTDKLFVHLVHRNGTVNGDHVPGWGSYPLDKWEPGQYVTDEHTLHIPGTWGSGPARLMVGFWNSKSGKRFPISGTQAAIDDTRLVVATVDVKATARPRAVSVEERRKKAGQWISQAPSQMEKPINATFDHRVELVGANLTRTDVHLAGTVEVTYLFKALDDVPADWKLTAKLVRDDGVTIDGDHVPIGGLYPPGDWRKGDFVSDLHRIHIDMHLCKPGTYGLWLGFKSARGPVPVSAQGAKVDSAGRVRITTVEIRPGEKPGM